ncbi:MAG: hypothetical protein QNL62_01390 [Gammaproteobacteria bacterium]|nr:hypothetical protein [Gammaproteobacteria bacterium]
MLLIKIEIISKTTQMVSNLSGKSFHINRIARAPMMMLTTIMIGILLPASSSFDTPGLWHQSAIGPTHFPELLCLIDAKRKETCFQPLMKIILSYYSQISHIKSLTDQYALNNCTRPILFEAGLFDAHIMHCRLLRVLSPLYNHPLQNDYQYL